MTLTPGTKVGPYEVTTALGAGGMGEVYRAHDARLGRDVAIKVLPESVSKDPVALARFEREARAVGALSHPNIVNIFDVGSERGISYVVMELLEGETLRARLQTSVGPAQSAAKSGTGSGSHVGLPRKKALDVAIQMAQGLAAAHAKGIVHRDLKPENIFIAPDGRVKILDFGLARAIVPAGTNANAETVVSPTVAMESSPGMVLGTVGYMAPEQVRAQAVDHRADIFAFGAVLFEMLTGERAFAGDSAIETMSAILKGDPLEAAAATVHVTGPIEPILRHCLEKQPDERFQSARDLAFQLQAVASGTLSTGSAPTMIEGRAVQRRWLLPAAVAVVALAAGLAIGRSALAPAGPATLQINTSIVLPDGVRLYTGLSPARSGHLSVSPDGRQVAFVGDSSSERQIYVRALDADVARPIAGTEGGVHPSWSPDGRRLAFIADGKLKQIAVDGAAGQPIADIGNPRTSAAWGPDDTLLFHSDYRHALMRVSASGGTPQVIVPSAGANVSWFSPVWLPDGRRFLVVRFAYAEDAAEGSGIYTGSVGSPDLTLVVPGRISEVTLGTREIFYRRGTDLVAQAFDVEAANVSGDPRVLSDHVSLVTAAGDTLVSYAPPGGLSLGQRIAWVARDGKELSQIGVSGTFRDPRLSPNERSIAIARADDNGLFEVWTYDLVRSIDTRVSGATFVAPAWSRDGQSILSGRAGAVFRFPIGGEGSGSLVAKIAEASDFVSVQDIAPNGREAIVRMIGDNGVAHMAVLTLDGTSQERTLVPRQRTQSGTAATISPDGKWVVHSTTVGTATRLVAIRYEGGGATIPVTGVTARYPVWRRDGRELFFLATVDGAYVVMTVPVTWSGGAPDFGPAQVLFKAPDIVVSNLGFDVSGDGQRFLMVLEGERPQWPLMVRFPGVFRK